jgi:Ca2+-binding RTX toxin-like protein
MRTVSWTAGGTTAITEIADSASAAEVRQIIQTALDNAAAAATDAQQATVTLSAGTFVVDGTGIASHGCLQLRSNVILEGSQDPDGNWSKIDLDDSYSGDVTGVVRTVNNYYATGEDPTHNVTIRNLVIEGGGSTASESVDGIYAGNYSGDLMVRDPARSQYNVTIENVDVSQCSRYGIDPHEQITNLTITNSDSHDNGKDGFALDYVEGATLNNNEAYGNGRHGFNIMTGSYAIVMTGNVAHGNGYSPGEQGHGIVIQPPSTSTDPRVIYSYDITITGGSVYDNAYSGIKIANGQDITVEGVNITGNLDSGVWVTNQVRGASDPVIPTSNDVTIAGNTITGNGWSADAGAEVQAGANTSNIFVLGNRIGAATNYDYNFSASVGTVTIEGNRYETGSVSTNFENPLTIPDDPAAVGAMTLHSWSNAANSINYDAGRQYVRANGGNDTVSTGAGNDALLGGTGNDDLDGGSGNDALAGGDGNDTLDGGTGADKMHGGLGDDVMIVDDVNDIVKEGFNAGTDLVQASVTYSIFDYANVENLTLTGSSAINGTGNNAANTITGNTGANTLTGNNGADTIVGGSGADTINGGQGSDSLSGNTHNDVLTGGLARDTLAGGGGNDTFRFVNISDSGTGATARDVITDFSLISGNDDIIDVSTLDANELVSGNQAFSWIGTAAFSAAGQIRITTSGGNTIVQGSTDADTAAEFAIEITGLPALTAADFIL